MLLHLQETQLETEARTASYEKNIITTELESFKDTIAKVNIFNFCFCFC